MKDIHKPQQYIRISLCFLYSLPLDTIVAFFPAYFSKSLLNELSEVPLPGPLFFLIPCHEIPKEELVLGRSSPEYRAEEVKGIARLLLAGKGKRTSIYSQLFLQLTELKNKHKLPVGLH